MEGLDKEAVSKHLIEAESEEVEKEEGAEEAEDCDQNEIDLPVDKEAIEANLEAEKKDKDPDEFGVEE